MMDYSEIDTISKAFTESFSSTPSLLVNAPGRINLIGEHTDYNGYPVFPISIPQRIVVAVSPRNDNIVRIRNVDSTYPETTFTLSREISPSETGCWVNYVKAAVNALMSRLDGSFHGFDALFDGTIPSSAGLSSSSALVVASALSFLGANDLEMAPIELAEMMAWGEHYVGTQGGGMDQAICLLGKKDHAVKIDFFPLHSTYANFPAGYSIVAAHSLVRAAKTENALLQYNRRPAECRLATALINTRYLPHPLLNRLGDLPGQEFYESFDSPSAFVEATFTKDSYKLDEIIEITGKSRDEVYRDYLYTRSGEPMPIPSDGFLVKQRAMHVLTEAERVEKSLAVLNRGNARAFGQLMNESHASCDRQYGISTPELNELTAIMRNNGALGARLTGAGFGGCAICLVHDSNIESVVNACKSDYYGRYLFAKRPDLVENRTSFDSYVFTVKPADGASTKHL